MRFLFDHDVPDDLSHWLPQLGHEVLLLRHVLAQDASDLRVLEFSHENDLLLVTCNRDDFLNLAKDNLIESGSRDAPAERKSGSSRGFLTRLYRHWRA